MMVKMGRGSGGADHHYQTNRLNRSDATLSAHINNINGKNANRANYADCHTQHAECLFGECEFLIKHSDRLYQKSVTIIGD
jgi:hypothetical protein